MVKHTHTILVVDDIPDWRETIKDLLEDEGYIVVIAESIVEAEEKLKEMSFELAVLDMRLDESDESNIEGLDKLARTIRDNYSHMKTIIFTGYATSKTLQQAMQPDDQGQQLAAFYMEKTETDKLADTVKDLLVR